MTREKQVHNISQPTAERLFSVGLSREQQDNYSAIFKGIRTHCEDIIKLSHPMAEDDLVKVFAYASMDNQIYTALSHDLQFYYDENGDVVAIRLSFLEDAEQVEKNRETIDNIANKFVEYALAHIESDAMRVAFFVHVLAKNVVYPNEIFDMNFVEHADEIARYQSLAGVFIDKRAICLGFARALSLLCGRAGIECWVVHGKHNSLDGLECRLNKDVPLKHAWNVVEIDGMRAHVDIVLAQAYFAEKDNGIDYFPVFFDEDVASKLGYGEWMRPLPQTPASTLSYEYAFVKAA